MQDPAQRVISARLARRILGNALTLASGTEAKRNKRSLDFCTAAMNWLGSTDGYYFNTPSWTFGAVRILGMVTVACSAFRIVQRSLVDTYSEVHTNYRSRHGTTPRTPFQIERGLVCLGGLLSLCRVSFLGVSADDCGSCDAGFVCLPGDPIPEQCPRGHYCPQVTVRSVLSALPYSCIQPCPK